MFNCRGNTCTVAKSPSSTVVCEWRASAPLDTMHITCLNPAVLRPSLPHVQRRTRNARLVRCPLQCQAKLSASGHLEVSRRRDMLQAIIALGTPLLWSEKASARQDSFDWSSPGLASPEDDDAPKFYKTDSGVKVQQLSAGSGRPAALGDTVTLEYVLRRSNGYFIYSTVEGVSFQPRDVPTGPFTFKLGDPDVVQGLQEAVTGMQPGGKRRALVPPQMGFVSSSLQPQPPTFATQRQLLNHSQEPLLFEIQMLKVRG